MSLRVCSLGNTEGTGAVMLLSLIQAKVPTSTAVGDAEVPALSRAGQGKPIGRAATLTAAGASGIFPAGHCSSLALPWGCVQRLPASSSSQHPAQFASAREILIVPGRGEAATVGTVQPSDPGASNPCRIIPLSQHSLGLLRGRIISPAAGCSHPRGHAEES